MMSANNWAICPVCKKNQKKKVVIAAKRVAAAYGNVTEDKYLEMKESLSSQPKLENSLREDYELLIDEEGLFSVSYRAICKVCGFNFVYEYQKYALKDRNDNS